MICVHADICACAHLHTKMLHTRSQELTKRRWYIVCPLLLDYRREVERSLLKSIGDARLSVALVNKNGLRSPNSHCLQRSTNTIPN
uniref:Uncharacterized protein n=1 Tax=Anguilla anguilla TaxID=7936 RepID=A0A0E9PPV3_ANGAN